MNSHDLAFLLDVAGRHTTTTPVSAVHSDWVTPWAVAARYGVSDASVDRGAAVAVAEEAVSWALIHEADPRERSGETRDPSPESCANLGALCAETGVISASV